MRGLAPRDAAAAARVRSGAAASSAGGRHGAAFTVRARATHARLGLWLASRVQPSRYQLLLFESARLVWLSRHRRARVQRAARACTPLHAVCARRDALRRTPRASPRFAAAFAAAAP
jgi:hypothetical protein